MFFRTRYALGRYRHYSKETKSEKAGKYSSTVILPKTGFPQYLKKTAERDSLLYRECGFADLYEWQRKNADGKEFTLLDGPPYANGDVHIGHAINKISKDIINRSQLLQGKKVHFVPGWDCHGLPIELKASSSKDSGRMSAVEVRKRAREFATKTIREQKAAFESWGVMAAWDSSIYQTFDPSYVTKQLQMWWELYTRALIYRDLKPVYWSPSSETALAEAELLYKTDHISRAVTLRLKVDGAPFTNSSNPVYILIWTTTPWTLPVNEAVCYSKDLQYSIVTLSGLEGMYIVATDCLPNLQEKWKREATVVQQLEKSALSGLRYRHPWRPDSLQPLIEASHVTASGTGLVHSAPAHGHDDFLVGLKNGLSTISLIDGRGRYISAAGEKLAGLSALTEGVDVVIQELRSDIIHEEKYTHSYPYDWRTNKPVMIRASQQWFIDTSKLKVPALECLDKVSGSTDRLRSLLSTRPYWCISRQRAWGVPIPAFYHKTSGRPLLSKMIVDRLCQHVNEGSSDAWWTLSNADLFPKSACEELCVKIEDLERGGDIMDIWVDSGLAWMGLEGRIADICIEGTDQHTGWFQSSLLTSVGIRDVAPVRRILTHGFAVDETGKKMSKSVGNVVDPKKVMESVGVDALRWWVASHSHHSQVPVSDRLILASKEQVTRLRGTLRFLLGALANVSSESLAAPPSTVLDQYMLRVCRDTYDGVLNAYNNHAWNVVCTNIVNFASGPVSGLYVHVIKDRLYCDSENSPRRLGCLSTLSTVLETLTACLAPVLPHLAEEVYRHHPITQPKFWFRKDLQPKMAENIDQNITEVIEKALSFKSEIDKQTVSTGTAPLACHLHLNKKDFLELQRLQSEKESWDSELTELLQVACVRIEETGNDSSFSLQESEKFKCPRCRRFTACQEGTLCSRCHHVLH